MIIRKDLVERGRQDIPTVWRYSVHAKHNSLCRTPTTFAVAMMRHVLEHTVELGGVAAIEAANGKGAPAYRRRSRRGPTSTACRPRWTRESLMNVVFFVTPPEARQSFWPRRNEGAWSA